MSAGAVRARAGQPTGGAGYNDAALLPLTSAPRNVLVTGWGVTTTRALGDAIARRGRTVTVLETGTTPNQASIDEAVAQAANNDLVVASTMNPRASM